MSVRILVCVGLGPILVDDDLGGSTDWASHPGRSPSNDLELGVHLADVIASNPNHRLPVLDPATELRDMLGRCEHSEYRPSRSPTDDVVGDVPTIDRESMLS